VPQNQKQKTTRERVVQFCGPWKNSQRKGKNMPDAIARALPKINGFTLRRPNLLPVLGFISLLLMVSLFFVWSRVQVTSLEYEMSQLESKLRGLRQEASNLSLEAASLRDPERIERVARKELNLRLPSSEQVITVD
jgi:cell division protein FtsL